MLCDFQLHQRRRQHFRPQQHGRHFHQSRRDTVEHREAAAVAEKNRNHFNLLRLQARRLPESFGSGQKRSNGPQSSAFGLSSLKDGQPRWKCPAKECKSVFDDVRAVLEHILGGKVRCCYCKPAAFYKFSITSLQAHIKTNTHSELGVIPSTELIYSQQDKIKEAESLMKVFGINVKSAELKEAASPRAYEIVSLESADKKKFSEILKSHPSIMKTSG